MQVLSQEQFNAIAEQKKACDAEIEKWVAKKEVLCKLQARDLGDISDEEGIAFDEAIESAIDRCTKKIDQQLYQIDSLFTGTPEVVTGGGYELYLARLND